MRLTRWLGIILGIVLVGLGVAETVRLTRSGDGGLLFWFGTLVGGGVLILVGTALRDRFARVAPALIVSGCVIGLVPTMWSIIVPLALIVLMILTLRAATAATPEPTG